MKVFTPVFFTTALFIAVFFMDLFNHNYKTLPIHALTGFFCILVVSSLVQLGFHGTAWLLVASPFLFIIGSILIRDHRRYLSGLTTLHPGVPKHTYDPAPYYL
jgi:uncharacterized membrane protein YjjB (DUF3815 family)